MTTVVDGVGQSISHETRDGSDEAAHVLAKVAIGERPAPVKAKAERDVRTRRYNAIHFRKGCSQRLVTENTPNPCCGSGLNLIGVHGLARGNADYIWFDFFEHVFIVTEGWDIAPNVSPAGDKFRSRFRAVIEYTNDLSFRNGSKSRGKIVMGQIAQQHAVAARNSDPQRVFLWPSLWSSCKLL